MSGHEPSDGLLRDDEGEVRLMGSRAFISAAITRIGAAVAVSYDGNLRANRHGDGHRAHAHIRLTSPVAQVADSTELTGLWACVCCGAPVTRQGACDECGGVVVLLDEDHVSPVDQWPAAHRSWHDTGLAATQDGRVCSRRAGGLVWNLTVLVRGPSVRWHLQADGWDLTRSDVQLAPSPGAVWNRSAQAARVMADRFITGYLAARAGGDTAGGEPA